MIREYNLRVQWVFLILALQSFPLSASPPAAVRGDRFQIIVPQGWKTLLDDEDVLLQHTTGASLLVRRIASTRDLASHAQQQAERIMTPLGFAKLGDPGHFKDTHDEWVQYEILGNRLSEHRRLLYRVLRRDSAFFEFVFEAGEDGFEMLLTEAESIAASVQAIIDAPARSPRSAARRRR
jgi:hypothetical protein